MPAHHAAGQPSDADVELVIRRWQGEDLPGDGVPRVFDFEKVDFGAATLAAATSPWAQDLARQLVADFFAGAHGHFGRKAQLAAGAELISGDPVTCWIEQVVHTKERDHVSGVTGGVSTDYRHELESITLRDATTHHVLAPLDPRHLPGDFGHSWGVVWGTFAAGEVVVIANPRRRTVGCTSVLTKEEAASRHAHWIS